MNGTVVMIHYTCTCTFKLIRDPVFHFDVDKQHGERERMVVLVTQRDVSESRADVVHREAALTNQLAVVVKHGHSQNGQLGE